MENLSAINRNNASNSLESKKRVLDSSSAIIDEITSEMPRGNISHEEVVDEYGFIKIIKNEDDPLYRYFVDIKLTPEEKKILEQIKDRVISSLNVNITNKSLEEKKTMIKAGIIKFINTSTPLPRKLPPEKIELLATIATMDIVGYGILDPLIEDDNLEEIMVIGHLRPVYVYHRKYGMCITNIIFPNEAEIRAIIEKIANDVGRRIDNQSPLLDARLPDGSRVNATLPPVTPDGPTLTIRKFKKDPLTIINLIKFGTLDVKLAGFLWMVVDGLGVKPANILVSGGTGSGKTTLLNSLATFIPPHERVISIEDTAELQLPIKHWVRMETRPPNLEGEGEITMDDLLKNTLRMRPDRIIVGEVRGKEAATLFAALNTGHDGTMGTIHANNSKETITRLESPPMNVPKIMIPALDFIIMVNRFYRKDRGTFRRVMEVSEIAGIEKDSIQLSRLFTYDAYTDSLEPTGVPSMYLQKIARAAGLTIDEIYADISQRAAILEWMVKRDLTSIDKVGEVVKRFYYKREELLKKILPQATIDTEDIENMFKTGGA